MDIKVERCEYIEIETMRDLYRMEAKCQIKRDSMLRRGLADAYQIIFDGRNAGYGGVLNKYDAGRLMEFYLLPERRQLAQPVFSELIRVSGATHVEAQTNIPLSLQMFFDVVRENEIIVENILFEDGVSTQLACPGVDFRKSVPEDKARIFEHKDEPVGDWVLEFEGEIAATGGFLCHYNPPYGDIYMEVAEKYRRKGLGSYLVQEIKKVCYEAGKRPAARCDRVNFASRKTLVKAGMLPCARILTGEIEPTRLVLK